VVWPYASERDTRARPPNLAPSQPHVFLPAAALFGGRPQLQWKDLIQQISYASGFAGDVSEVTVSPPAETGDALKFTYTYNRKDFP